MILEVYDDYNNEWFGQVETIIDNPEDARYFALKQLEIPHEAWNHAIVWSHDLQMEFV